MGKAEIGRIFGIPIVLDASFVLLIALFGFGYFTSASLVGVSYGLALVAGVAVSILLHELGHALAAGYWRVPTASIELNGLGGLCHFARNMPADRLANIVMLLAVPAADLIVWQVFSTASDWVLQSGTRGPELLLSLLRQLGHINFLLFIFNLMPAHPLDGGRALVQVASKFIGYDRAMRAIAYLGLLVVAWLVMLAFGGQMFAALIAFVLLQANIEVLQTHGGPRWKRWN